MTLTPSPKEPAQALGELRQTLVHSLMASKGWMRGYAEAFFDDAIDRLVQSASPQEPDSMGASPSGTACSVASLPEPEVSALRVPPAGAEVVPRYEDNEVVAWDVWSGRQEVRPGVWTGDFHDTFDNETDAIDLVGALNAAARKEQS
jgi:hypothetical protein